MPRTRPPRARTVGLAAALSAAIIAAPIHAQDAHTGFHVFRLDAGPTILYQRVPGASIVALEEIYPVGLVHDPEGITQGTHLVEHLRCMAATASFAPGEAFATLNARGLANAETMGDLTHYDLVVPRDDLALALRIIAQRATSLVVTDDLIDREAPRCAAEVEAVARFSGGPGLKFALAAVTQRWRHAQGEARLLSGLDAWPATDVADFIAATHRPDRLTIAIAADLDPAELEASVRTALAPLAAVPPAPSRPPGSIDIDALPPLTAVTWDVPASAFFLAYAPPPDPDRCLAVSLWCMAAAQRLTAATGAQPGALALNAHSYPVGALPIFAYRALTPDEPDPRAAAEALARSIETLAADPGSILGARLVAQSLADAARRGFDPRAFNASVDLLAARVGREQAERLALGNIALEIGLLWHALGPDPHARLDALLAHDADWWTRTLTDAINARARRVTLLNAE